MIAGVPAALNFAPGSSTHRLPPASNVTPWGVPTKGLVIVICGTAALVPPASWVGMYSSTFMPFAIHRAVLGGVLLLCLHAMTTTLNRTAAISIVGRGRRIKSSFKLIIG